MSKRNVTLGILLALAFFLLPPAAFAASSVGSYTLTIPAGTATTMGDASITLPITVNNLVTSTATIAYVRLDFNANVYYISLANTAPAGWTVSTIKNAGVGQTYIEFTSTAPANNIPINGSRTFNVILTGSNNGNIPAAAADMTDAVVDDNNGTVLTISGPNSNYFDRAAAGNTDNWQRKALFASMSAVPSAVGSGGMITITLTVTNRSTAAQATVRPFNSSLTVNSTGTASAAWISGPTPASVGSLAAGSSATFQWIYQANGSGSLEFCDSATNGAVTATSKTVCSNIVAVGGFTALLSVSPTQIVSGQSVTVVMTVTNNGSTTLHNITPTLITAPGNYLSGPTPASIGTLAAGASSTVQWVYSLTGNVGDSFTFSGNATDQDGNPSAPDTAYSNPVTITAYSVTVNPPTVPSGSANVTFTFRVTNNGGYGLQQVRITSPDAGFVYSAAAGGCAGNWNVVTGGAPTWVRFRTGADYVPAGGGACNFSVTYSSVPAVASNTNYNFRIDVWDTQTPVAGDPRASLGAIVTVTSYGITVIANPPSGDPNCPSIITATVTPTPAINSTVNFTTTAGTLSSASALTNAVGEAPVTLRAPLPFGVANGTVTATFQGAAANVVVTFLNGAQCAAGWRIIDWREVIN